MKYADIVRDMRFKAFTNKWNGTEAELRKILHVCRHQLPGITCPDALVTILLTYDYGHHACGWWKNSQYDECLHLSISISGHRKGSNFKMLREPEQVTAAELHAWSEAIFAPLGPDVMKWLWLEHGKKTKAIEHVRLFYSKITQEPILPTGEVYSLIPYSDGSSPEKVFNRAGK